MAVYSETDAKSLAVQLADRAVCIGPDNVNASYLNIAAIISAAQLTGADAIHPGYGFLSESPEFADACLENGIKLIGPSGDVMRLLGDKEQARMTVAKAGLPVVKGSSTTIDNLADALDQAQEIGYPIMVKASAGGGGKGMRIVNSPKEMAAKFRSPKMKPKPRLAAVRCIWNSIWPIRGILRCRLLPIVTAMRLRWVNGTVRFKHAIKKLWKKHRLW